MHTKQYSKILINKRKDVKNDKKKKNHDVPLKNSSAIITYTESNLIVSTKPTDATLDTRPTTIVTVTEHLKSTADINLLRQITHWQMTLQFQ